MLVCFISSTIVRRIIAITINALIISITICIIMIMDVWGGARNCGAARGSARPSGVVIVVNITTALIKVVMAMSMRL